MRIGMVSALSVLLPLIYFPCPMAGQSRPASPQAAPGVPSEAGIAAKLSERPRGAESGGDEFRFYFKNGDEFHFYLKNDPTKVPQINRFFSDLQERAGRNGNPQSPLGTGRCAHIVIYQAPTMDSEMIKESPRAFARNMPTFEGLQPCCRDFRRVMAIPQGALFVSPGRIGALSPNP
jgi:hypothetical protein